MVRVIAIILSFIFITAAFSSCSNSAASKKKLLNERISLRRNDKIPYGSYVAYENLRYVFPDAYITPSAKAPEYGYNTTYHDSSEARDVSAYIIIAENVRPEPFEVPALLSKAPAGEHVLIVADEIGEDLLDSLHLAATHGINRYAGDSIHHSILDPVSYDSFSYTYPGLLADNYFTKLDSNITTIIGNNSKGKANFVKFDYNNGGSLSICLSPLSFSNFFLLHKNNIEYYNKALSHLPVNITSLVWDDYFRNASPNRFSAFGFLMKQQAFQWAIPLVLVLCAIVFFIESKRRQRMVPELPPLQNSSLDFVNTIGRLYFQQKDHKNLAQKMIAHFLENVRSRYGISTSVLDSFFIEKFSYKAGFDKEDVADLIADINQININISITEQELFMFSKKIEKFK